jgi:hypothetical protein
MDLMFGPKHTTAPGHWERALLLKDPDGKLGKFVIKMTIEGPDKKPTKRMAFAYAVNPDGTAGPLLHSAEATVDGGPNRAAAVALGLFDTDNATTRPMPAPAWAASRMNAPE